MRLFKQFSTISFWLILAMTMIAGFLVLPAIGQDKAAEPAEKSVGPFSGTVVDAGGKPVAGAKVWLQGGSLPDSIRVLAQTVTDEKGRFQFEKVKYEIPSERGMPFIFLARDSAGRIGGADRFRQGPDNAQSKELQLKLQEVKDCRGRLDGRFRQTDRQGENSAHGIGPTSIARKETSAKILFFIHADLGNELAAETDADGDFTLRNMPVMGRINVQITAKGFGEPIAMWKVEKPVILQLAPVGTVQGSVICSKDPGATAAVKLRLQQTI